MIRFSARRGVVAAAVGAAVMFLTAAEPPGGPPGLGDRLYPGLGNPGYDVTSYDIALTYRGNDRPLDAVTRVDARATALLEHFNLDYEGTVRSVQVNGRPARHSTDQEELVITPAAPVPAGTALRITVTHTSDPAADDSGWIRTGDGLVMANQADAAHRVFPCNDHPSDKAAFTFRVTAPDDLTVVANGLPEPPAARRAGRTWTYRTHHPMATELAQVSIGRSAVVHRPGPHGLPLRDVIGTPDRDRLESRLALTPGQVEWMEAQVGPYPFETYGVLSADATTGFALETQTLSLFERRLLLAPERTAAPIMVHELAHQWFGNSVAPAAWSDLWLNEGHATWYEWRFSAERYGENLDRLARDAYTVDNDLRAEGGPPARPRAPGGEKLGIFRGNVYTGGALALYALRQEIGADVFQRLERAWVHRHRDGTASTADFIALASETAGRDLSGFLGPWLYGATTPPMPGHTDWRSAVPAADRTADRTEKPE